LDLANSEGITHRLFRYPSNDRDAGGLLDIGVGGNLEMIKSRIVSHNGAAIRLHGLDGPESPVGGIVNVGTNANGGGFGDVLGIVTLRGGGIDINATGNIEVNLSRVATFGGGDIAIASGGDINAGSGGRDERVQFVFEQRDENGNVVLDPRTGQPVRTVASVPGSGIFTFHPDDPDPLPDFPPPPDPKIPGFEFDLPSPDEIPLTPEMITLDRQILRHAFLGHDVLGLATKRAELQQAEYVKLVEQEFESQVRAYEADVNAAVEAASQEYERIKADHIKDWKLGDIYLEAAEDVVVPPAGIRGRIVDIKAKKLVLVDGGEVEGSVQLDIEELIGPLEDLKDVVGGGIGGERVLPVFITPPPPPLTFSPPPPSTSTGNLSLGLSGATGTLSSVNTASTVAEAVTEETIAPGAGNAPGDATGVDSDDREGKKGDKPVRSVRLKRGVTIEVQVSPEKL
jgi:hypothetical protein